MLKVFPDNLIAAVF